MDRINAMVTARVVAVYFIMGAITCALMAFLFPALIMTAAAQAPNAKALPAAFGIIFALIFLVIGAGEAVVGWGLWTYRNWARITFIVLASIGIVIGILYILLGIIASTVGEATTTPASPFPVMLFVGGMGLFIIAVNSFLIWLFGFQKDIKALFTERNVAPIARVAKKKR